MTSQTRYDLLEKLADKLDTLSPEVFEIETWQKETKCGTVTCAIGHACTMPEFQEAGLRLSNKTPVYISKSGTVLSWDMPAVRQCLGLGWWDAYNLFSPGGYEMHYKKVEPQIVAVKIRAFVALKKSLEQEEGSQSHI